MVNYNSSVLHDCIDAKPQRVWNQYPDFFGSHDIIGHVTIGLTMGTFLLMVNDECIYLAPLWKYKVSKLRLAHLKGIKNYHIFGIFVVILSLCYTTFMGLR